MSPLPPAAPAPDDPTWFDADSHTRATEIAQAAISHALTADMNLQVQDRDGREHVAHVTLLDSVAGGGKTYVVTDAVRAARQAGLRTLVVTPGNEQVADLTRRTHEHLAEAGDPGYIVVLHRKSNYRPDPELAAYAAEHGIILTADPQVAATADVIVSTLHKVSSAYTQSHHDLGAGQYPFGITIVDETYQAKAGVFAAPAVLSNRILLVGDPGQLKPFSPDPAGTQWRGHVEDPLHSAASMLLARHGSTLEEAGARFRLPITRRLPAPALPAVRRFYPDHPFTGWAHPGTRLVDTSTGVVDRDAAHVRAALSNGWAHLLLPPAITDIADPEIADVVARTAAAAVTTTHLLASERTGGTWRPLTSDRVAVLVTHNEQRIRVREALASLLPNTPPPIVGTANTLQGLEYDLTVIWYPLAGAIEFDGFRGDPARLAVMLTRHRHGCVVVGRGSDQAMYNNTLPPLGSWDGTADDPITTGWLVHRGVLDDLAAYRQDVEPAGV